VVIALVMRENACLNLALPMLLKGIIEDCPINSVG
jgi:hypothetical protein